MLRDKERILSNEEEEAQRGQDHRGGEVAGSLKALEDENRGLKSLVADLSLEKEDQRPNNTAQLDSPTETERNTLHSTLC